MLLAGKSRVEDVFFAAHARLNYFKLDDKWKGSMIQEIIDLKQGKGLT